MKNRSSIFNTKQANEAEKSNQKSPLASLPAEVQLLIFEALLRAISGRQDGEYKISNMFFQQPLLKFDKLNLTSAMNFLSNYGSLCRSLRDAAVTAYYKQAVLKLVMIEDAIGTRKWRSNKGGPRLISQTWDRFGKLEFPYWKSTVSVPLSLSHYKKPGWPETTYAVELPPRSVRPLIRRINIVLVVPDGLIQWIQTAPGSARCTHFISFPYSEESNDWLAPIFRVYKGYRFVKLARMTVSFGLRHHYIWNEAATKDMMMWVEKKLRADAEVAKALDSGMMGLNWPLMSWKELRES